MQLRGLTIDHRDQVRLLRLAALDVDGHANQRIHHDVVHASLQMELQVLPFIAKELAMLNDDSNLLRKPTGSRPKDPMVRIGDGCVEHEHGWDTVDALSSRYRLVSLTPTAPSFGGCLPLDAILEDLGKSGSRHLCAPTSRFLIQCQLAWLTVTRSTHV